MGGSGKQWLAGLGVTVARITLAEVRRLQYVHPLVWMTKL